MMTISLEWATPSMYCFDWRWWASASQGSGTHASHVSVTLLGLTLSVKRYHRHPGEP